MDKFQRLQMPANKKSKQKPSSNEQLHKGNRAARKRQELHAKKEERKALIARNEARLKAEKKSRAKDILLKKVGEKVGEVGKIFRPAKVIGIADMEDLSPAKKPVGKLRRYSSEVFTRVGGFLATIKWLLIIICVLFVLLAGAVLTVFLVWGRDLPDVRELKAANFAETTTIYDRDGNVLYRIFGDENRTYVALKDVNQLVIDATISIEDKNFQHHFGFDPVGIVRAQLNNMNEENNLQGASTITQQLAKNLYLSPEKSFDRKIKELLLALEIEFYYSKDEILEMYFNKIPYGSNAFGIEAASKTFFGKTSGELNLVEASILAALPKAPSRFSPYGSNRKELLGYCLIENCQSPDDANYVWGRKDLVLQRMLEDGKISREQLEEAWRQGFEVKFQDLKHTINSPHFVFYVKDYLEKKYGKEVVESGGLEVVTTLDPGLQASAEKVLTDNYESSVKKYGANNAAMVVIDPKTGGVLAMVGSLNYWDESIDGQVNVTTSLRQPGSSFKPLVYANAIEQAGIGSGTILGDYKTKFGDNYLPNNSDNKFGGRMTVRKALAASRNIPAIKAWYLGGEEQPMLDFLDKVGVTSLREYKETYNSNPERKWDYSFGPAMAIGSGEVRLVDQAGAFAAFANSGRFNPVNPILEVRDRHGNVLEKFEDHSVQAMMPETAYIINSILSDVYARPAGTWRNTLTIPGQNVAAKTGTSNKKIGRANYPNNLLTFSYTPTILVATWVGNSDGSQMYLSAWGLVASAPINKQFLEGVLKDKPMVEFEKPESIIQVGSEYYPPNWDKKKNYDSRFRPAVLKDCTDEERRLEPTACKSKEQMEKEAEAKKAEEEAKKAAEGGVPERPLNTGEVSPETPPAPEPAVEKPSDTPVVETSTPPPAPPTVTLPPQISSPAAPPAEPELSGPTPAGLEPEHPLDFSRDD